MKIKFACFFSHQEVALIGSHYNKVHVISRASPLQLGKSLFRKGKGGWEL